MMIDRRNGRWILATKCTTYFNDSTWGFLRDCRRAFLRWIAG